MAYNFMLSLHELSHRGQGLINLLTLTQQAMSVFLKNCGLARWIVMHEYNWKAEKDPFTII